MNHLCTTQVRPHTGSNRLKVAHFKEFTPPLFVGGQFYVRAAAELDQKKKKLNVCFLFLASTSRGGWTHDFESPPLSMSQRALMACCCGSRLVKPPARCLRHPLAPLRTLRPVFMLPLQQSIRFSRKLKTSVSDRGCKPSRVHAVFRNTVIFFFIIFLFSINY